MVFGPKKIDFSDLIFGLQNYSLVFKFGQQNERALSKLYKWSLNY